MSDLPRIEELEREITFTFARASGPGGQNVNKVASRATLAFDVNASRLLSESTKDTLRRRLKTRIHSDGTIRVVAGRFRTQLANRRDALQRLGDLLERALAVTKPRRPTRPSAGARKRRLEAKRRAGDRKALRRAPRDIS